MKIGASSRDIRQSAAFTLGKGLTAKKETVSLVPKAVINELKPEVKHVEHGPAFTELCRPGKNRGGLGKFS